MTERLAHPARRWRSELPYVVPALVVLAAVLSEAGRAHWVASEPFWVYLVALAGAASASYAVDGIGPDRPAALVQFRFATKAAAVTAVAYLTGWGPFLAAGLVYAMADAIEVFGSRWAPSAIAWSLVAIGAGQGLTVAGIAPTMLARARTEGLAAVTAAGLVAAGWVLGVFARRRELAEHQLLEERERFAALVQHSSDMIVVVRPDGRISYVSPSAWRFVGLAPSAERGAEEAPSANANFRFTARMLLHPDDLPSAIALFERVLEEPGRVVAEELRVRRADGEWRWVEAVCSNCVGMPGIDGVVVNARDVTRHKAVESELALRALRDPVTNLWNRQAFLEELKDLVDAHVADAGRQPGSGSTALRSGEARTGAGVGALFIDADRFKQVNDTFGHDVGDELLMALARRIAGCLRAEDVLGRFGGDEFVALLADVEGPRQVARAAERVVEACAAPFKVRGATATVPVSVGAVFVPACVAVSPKEILRRADLAMYAAKQQGRSRYVLEILGDGVMGDGVMGDRAMGDGVMGEARPANGFGGQGDSANDTDNRVGGDPGAANQADGDGGVTDPAGGNGSEGGDQEGSSPSQRGIRGASPVIGSARRADR
jgi:diguanylate cyclase (GGDEF)-like protein/PAS domain S-box-containing protein